MAQVDGLGWDHIAGVYRATVQERPAVVVGALERRASLGSGRPTKKRLHPRSESAGQAGTDPARGRYGSAAGAGVAAGPAIPKLRIGRPLTTASSEIVGTGRTAT